MSVRNSRLTEAEMAEFVKNDPDRRPWGGAGSVDLTAATIGKRNRMPNDARGKMGHDERAAFAEANQEATPLSPEEMQRVNEAVANNLKRADVKTYFANAVRNGIGLHQAWVDGGLPGECPLFENVERDGDPAGANQNLVRESMLIFADSPAFAAYRSKDEKSSRYKLQRQIMDLLWDFMGTNLVNMTVAQSWLTCFQLLQNIGLIPAPVPSTQQLEEQERSKPAEDGNPVALHDDGKTPVTYVKNGRTIRYSKQMLQKLTAKGYAMVMDLERSPREIQETETTRRQLKSHEYRTKIIGDTGYTQFELDSMPSEKYRKVMRLERSGGGSVGNRI